MQKEAKKYFKQLFKPKLRELKFKKIHEIKDEVEYKKEYNNYVQNINFCINFSGYIRDLNIGYKLAKPNFKHSIYLSFSIRSLTGLHIEDIDLLYDYFINHQEPFILNPDKELEIETLDPLNKENYDKVEAVIIKHLEKENFKLTYNYKNMRSHPEFDEIYLGIKEVTEEMLIGSIDFENSDNPKQTIGIGINKHRIRFMLKLNPFTREMLDITLSFFPSFSFDGLTTTLDYFFKLYHHFNNRAKQTPINLEVLKDIYQNKAKYIEMWKQKHGVIKGKYYSENDIYDEIKNDNNDDYKLSFAMFVYSYLTTWNIRNKGDNLIDEIVYDEKEKNYIYACHEKNKPYTRRNYEVNFSREFIAVKRTGRHYNFYANYTLKF